MWLFRITLTENYHVAMFAEIVAGAPMLGVVGFNVNVNVEFPT